ncbi:MAG TPA: diguanylate cyclase [Terriglobales bacterium]|nr:diguanylate cyclase [Terriglobales bacterium]
MTRRPQSWREMGVTTRVYIGVVIGLGVGVLSYGATHPSSGDLAKFSCYLIVALLASRLKVNLPGVTGTMSVNFLFILLGIIELSFSETLLLGCSAILVQCISRDRPRAVQVFFNICASALAIAVAYGTYGWARSHPSINHPSLLLLLGASAYFVANTLPVAGVISLTESKPLRNVWSECYFWSFPYYLMGAGIAGLMSWLNRFFAWQTSMLVLPTVFLVYRSYRLYLGKLESEKRHVEQMSNLHLRTIEALALAIEAKDHTTHDHLQRVRIYATEIGKVLQLSPDEMEALHAAALLHDIGKLAVPENIISKPGKLTPEEFEKMKIHPIVGAEILERVQFPYPVVPIVRAHHEKWDGSGYPYGLQGEQIPLGARILSAVDFLDALASDRQYRLALPIETVMGRLECESGKSFDPQIVRILQERYLEIEKVVGNQSGQIAWTKLSTEVKVAPGVAPATGLASRGSGKDGQSATFLSSIAAARQEVQTLFELTQDLGASLSLDETLSVFSTKLQRLVPFSTIAVYVLRDDELVPEHVSGDNFRLMAGLRIPVGRGISGWVVANKKPIINGNPVMEPGYPTAPGEFTPLRSVLAVPLEGPDSTAGVLSLYHAEKEAFTSDHLRILLAISSRIALAIENALRFQQAESSATTDYLTGLPNARSLFLQLDRELARCKRNQTTLTVMVTDMDGFKQVNDRFGHLEGNRVLVRFAQAMKESCREYDYVARMGGDEFVVVAPGLTAEAARSRSEHLQMIAKQAGLEVCGEDMLSLSVGQAVYPDAGLDAEDLLAEADRRMYLEKRKRPAQKNRRLHPRLRCNLPVELHPEGGASPVPGNLSNISLGGCYVQTSAPLNRGSNLGLSIKSEEGLQQVTGQIVWVDSGYGFAMQFHPAPAEQPDQLFRIMAFVENRMAQMEKPYLSKLGQ